MITVIRRLLVVLVIVNCSPSSKSPPTIDYLGQEVPHSNAEIFAPGLISIEGRLEHGISFNPDMDECVFGLLDKADYSGEIYYSNKVDEHWLTPQVFTPLKEKCAYLPYFTPDGQSLLYAQSKPDTNNTNTDIWIINKTIHRWNTPTIVQAPINSVSREANASMTNDGTIYFSSNRNCIGKNNCYSADIFHSVLYMDQYQDAQVITELSSSNDEESIFISPEEDYILFCRYTNNVTGTDLYISYRDINNKWMDATILDSTINSKHWDRRPYVSNNKQYLFFTQLQIGPDGLTESDIYWASTNKLFKPFVYNSIPDITALLGERFEITIPQDYFRDIDDNNLKLSLHQGDYTWLEYDKNERKITGVPTLGGVYPLIISAIDRYSNISQDTIILTVTES